MGLPPDAEPLTPGAAHPHPPRLPQELAGWFDVPAERVRRWCDRGLPTLPDGRIDAFVAVNWVADHDLDGAPLLRARWRRFLAWFAPFVLGQDRPVVRRVTRRHRLFLEDQVDPTMVRWFLPPLDGQHRIAADPEWIRAEGTVLEWVDSAHFTPLIGGIPELVPLVEELVAECRYGYRHHRAGADPLPEGGWWSCLDLAEALGQRLSDRGWCWRLRAGVVASSTLANPHFWIDVLHGGRWSPIDPSLPAIARQFPSFAGGVDWRQWVRAYTGGHDARRVVLACGLPPLDGIPGGLTHGGVAGEVEVAGRNAWACADWACGECRWDFGRR